MSLDVKDHHYSEVEYSYTLHTSLVYYFNDSFFNGLVQQVLYGRLISKVLSEG